MEFFGELAIEFIFEVITNAKISKWVRYPLCALVISLYLFIICSLFFLGIVISKHTMIMSWIVWVIDIVIIISLYKILKKVRG